MPGTTSVPGIDGWTCDVSVVATEAEASSVGISSTTLTTSASATSSATSCAGPVMNDSSRVEDEMSDDCVGALIGAELAARAFNGVADGALVVSGVGELVPLLCGRAGTGAAGSTCSSTTLLGARVACAGVVVAGVASGVGWAGVHGLADASAPIPTQLTLVGGLFSGYVCLNSCGTSGLVSMWLSVSIICLISSMLFRLFSSRPLNSAR